jgi:predicted transposase/invertase (TIGR01784 family)
MSVLDVKARTESGMLVDVEIQLRDRRDMAKRTLFYWAKLFQGQLQEGDHYRQLHKAVTINVLDFDYVPTDRYHSTFHLREDATGLMLTDLLEVHFVELQKLQAQAVGLERRLVRWMLFLTTKTREQLEELAMQEPALKKALTTLEFLSQDERTRQLYEERQKGLMTYTADVESAREEGHEEGREEGRQEGRQEGEHQRAETTARKMLLAGMDVRQIAEFVDLSVDAVEAIRRSLH